MSQAQYIFYFFQGEEGESLEVPNAFQLPGTSKITFGLFSQSFPLRNDQGRLHYRFREEDKTHGYVWKDVSSPDSILPTYKGNIFVKILRTDFGSETKRRTYLRRKKDAMWGVNGAKATPSPLPSKANERISSQQGTSASKVFRDYDSPFHDNLNGGAGRGEKTSSRGNTQFSDSPEEPITRPLRTVSRDKYKDASKSTAVPAEPKRKSETSKPVSDSHDLINGEPSFSPSVTASVTPPNLFDFDDAASPVVASSSSLSGSTSTNNLESIDVMATLNTPTGGLTRDELAARREANVQEKVKEALEFKQELDELARKEAVEVEEAKAKHDKALLAWAANNNEKRNVRTLLTSMHTVLWPDSGWKQVSLGDVIDSKKVKLFYRKAMLVVHPDRCSALTAEIRFIAKRIFEAINEAYQEFLKKEGVS